MSTAAAFTGSTYGTAPTQYSTSRHEFPPRRLFRRRASQNCAKGSASSNPLSRNSYQEAQDDAQSVLVIKLRLTPNMSITRRNFTVRKDETL